MVSTLSGGWRRIVQGTVTALSILAVVLPASAGQETRGSIIGTVTDQSEGVMPGVTVTVTSPALQGERDAVTDEQGRYRINPLPIGTYTMVFTLSGFRTLTRENVRLTAGLQARIDVSLVVGGVEETVTVSGLSPVVDVSSTEAATTLTRETLDVIPTARTGYNALLAQAPGVRDTLQALSPTSSPNFRAFGQSNQAYQSIDGVITSSPLLAQTGQYIDGTAFEEAVISTLGHDASIPTRGIVISTVIRTGGNDFHGQGFLGYTNQNFQSSNLTPELEARGVGSEDSLDLKDDWNGDVGGRILRDKLWFWGQGRMQRDKSSTQDCYQRSAPFTGPATQTGGDPCFVWQRAAYTTTKETLKLNNSNTINGMMMVTMRRDNEGATQFVAWERRRKQWNAFSPTFKGEWQSIQGSTRTMSLMFGQWTNRSGGWGEEFADGATPKRDLSTGYQWGTNPTIGERQHVFRQNVRWGMDWYKSDWLKGNHAFKVGTDVFRSEGNRARIDRKAPTYELRFRNGVANSIDIQNTPVSPTGRLLYVGPYIADTWTVGKKLTLNLGIRYAYDNGKVPATCRDAANGPGAVAFPQQCFDQIDYPSYNSVAPRLRFALDVAGNGKTLIKGGWGRYMLGRWFEEITTANRNVISTARYTWRDLNLNGDYDPGEVNLSTSGPDFQSITFAGQGGALANGIINPNQTQPWTDEYMGQFERELMPGFGLRLTGIHSRVQNWYRYENSLRPYGSYTIPVTLRDPGPDGITGNGDDPGTNLTYWEYPVALQPASFQAPWIVNDPAANKQYTSFEIAASKRLADRWSMQSSYSFTKIHDPLPNSTAGGTGAFEANEKTPNAEIFAADNTKEWQVRISGSYLAPWDLQLSMNYQSRSGAYWGRLVTYRGGKTIPTLTPDTLVEPRDSNQLPTINLTDFRVEKRLHFGGTKSLALRMNVFNLFNAATIQGITALSGPSFNKVTSITTGRLAEFNVAYQF
jgi:Carboxypeptidase regulatory-like domain